MEDGKPLARPGNLSLLYLLYGAAVAIDLLPKIDTSSHLTNG
jgi:hypothetical protein